MGRRTSEEPTAGQSPVAPQIAAPMEAEGESPSPTPPVDVDEDEDEDEEDNTILHFGDHLDEEPTARIRRPRSSARAPSKPDTAGAPATSDTGPANTESPPGVAEGLLIGGASLAMVAVIGLLFVVVAVAAFWLGTVAG